MNPALIFILVFILSSIFNVSMFKKMESKHSRYDGLVLVIGLFIEVSVLTLIAKYFG